MILTGSASTSVPEPEGAIEACRESGFTFVDDIAANRSRIGKVRTVRTIEVYSDLNPDPRAELAANISTLKLICKIRSCIATVK